MWRTKWNLEADKTGAEPVKVTTEEIINGFPVPSLERLLAGLGKKGQDKR